MAGCKLVYFCCKVGHFDVSIGIDSLLEAASREHSSSCFSAPEIAGIYIVQLGWLTNC